MLLHWNFSVCSVGLVVSVQLDWNLKKKTRGGGVGLLNKVLYGEAPPRGPSLYPLIYHFWEKRNPFRIPTERVLLNFSFEKALNPIQTGVGGGGFWIPRQLWRFVTYKLLKLWPPNLVTFPKIYLETFWHQCPLSINVDVSIATIFWQARFTKLRFFFFIF